MSTRDRCDSIGVSSCVKGSGAVAGEFWIVKSVPKASGAPLLVSRINRFCGSVS
jgi:hypothetical protein